MAPTLNPNSLSPFLDVVDDVVLLADPVRESPTRIIKRVAEISHDGSSVWVLGDNRDHSTDSRAFGSVPSVMVEGVVTAVIFPPWRVRSLVRSPS
jgi:type IV secretory pathway protease TraF